MSAPDRRPTRVALIGECMIELRPAEEAFNARHQGSANKHCAAKSPCGLGRR